MSKQGNCESWLNYVYDEEYECYTCLVDLDEDEMENFMRENTAGCPFFRFDNEYCAFLVWCEKMLSNSRPKQLDLELYDEKTLVCRICVEEGDRGGNRY